MQLTIAKNELLKQVENLYLEAFPASERKPFAMLEESIRRDPAIYLWSHDRWKRTREEFDREFKVEHGHVVEK